MTFWSALRNKFVIFGRINEKSVVLGGSPNSQNCLSSSFCHAKDRCSNSPFAVDKQHQSSMWVFQTASIKKQLPYATMSGIIFLCVLFSSKRHRWNKQQDFFRLNTYVLLWRHFRANYGKWANLRIKFGSDWLVTQRAERPLSTIERTIVLSSNKASERDGHTKRA